MLAAIRVDLFDMASGHRFHTHVHDEHQLVWAPVGVLTVEIRSSYWVLPPTLALWVPAGTPHATSATRPTVMQGVYMPVAGCPVGWERPTVVSVGSLLRSLLQHLDRDDLDAGERSRAEAVVFDLLRPVEVATIEVPMPTDDRAAAVARALIADPCDERGIEHWGRTVGASARTLTRLFTTETGMNFAQWRTQVKLRASLGHLASGMSVTAVAGAVGYRSASAFVAAFRDATGHTPGAYFAAAAEE